MIRAKARAFHWSLVSASFTEACAGLHTEFFTRHQNSAFWLPLRGLIIQTQRSKPQLMCSFSSRPETCLYAEDPGALRHLRKIGNVLGSLEWAPAAWILNVSLLGPALSLPSQDSIATLHAPASCCPQETSGSQLLSLEDAKLLVVGTFPVSHHLPCLK